MGIQTLRIHDEDFVLLPKVEFERLTGIPAGAVDAVEYMARSLARDLKRARMVAGLTQSALAKKLRKSQAMVSGAESGKVRVGERYVRAVLRACGLPENWRPEKAAAAKRARRPR